MSLLWFFRHHLTGHLAIKLKNHEVHDIPCRKQWGFLLVQQFFFGHKPAHGHIQGYLVVPRFLFAGLELVHTNDLFLFPEAMFNKKPLCLHVGQCLLCILNKFGLVKEHLIPTGKRSYILIPSMFLNDPVKDTSG